VKPESVKRSKDIFKTEFRRKTQGTDQEYKEMEFLSSSEQTLPEVFLEDVDDSQDLGILHLEAPYDSKHAVKLVKHKKRQLKMQGY
jgi:hypothetical protein